MDEIIQVREHAVVFFLCSIKMNVFILIIVIFQLIILIYLQKQKTQTSRFLTLTLMPPESVELPTIPTSLMPIAPLPKTRAPKRKTTIAPTQSGWQWTILSLAGHLVLRSQNGNVAFDYHIGAGGGIGWLKQGNVNFCAPGYRDEHNDRMIHQSTIWSNDVRAQVAGLRDFETRWNVTAGGSPFALAPILSIDVTEENGFTTLSVYSLAIEQFTRAIHERMKSRLAVVHKYSLLPDGVLALKRFILMGRNTVDGTPRTISGVYCENWQTVNNSVFRSLSTNVSQGGQFEGTRNLADLPYYLSIPASSTSGNLIAHSGNGPVLCYMFHRGGNQVVNYMRFNVGTGLLTATNLGRWEEGQVLEQSTFLVCRPTVSAELGGILRTYQPLVPASRLVSLQAIPQLDGTRLANAMAGTLGEGQRTWMLGSFWNAFKRANGSRVLNE